MQLSFDMVSGCTYEILGIGPRLDTGFARGLKGAEKQQSCLGWLTHCGKYLKYGDVPDAVDDKVVPGL